MASKVKKVFTIKAMNELFIDFKNNMTPFVTYLSNVVVGVPF